MNTNKIHTKKVPSHPRCRTVHHSPKRQSVYRSKYTRQKKKNNNAELKKVALRAAWYVARAERIRDEEKKAKQMHIAGVLLLHFSVFCLIGLFISIIVAACVSDSWMQFFDIFGGCYWFMAYPGAIAFILGFCMI